MEAKQEHSGREAPSINSAAAIRRRFEYARRYTEVVRDKNAVVCFIGVFSFVNCYSLSSCPPEKMHSFVTRDKRGGATRSVGGESRVSSVKLEEGQNKDLQYIAAITMTGVIYY